MNSLIKKTTEKTVKLKVHLILLLIAFNGYLGSLSAATTYKTKIYYLISRGFYGYAKPTIVGMSFLFIMWDLYQGFNKKNDKQTHWWAVGLAMMFIFILGVLPAIFNSQFGTAISETDTGGF